MNYEQKIEEAVRKADPQITGYTTDEEDIKTTKTEICNALGTRRCTAQMLNDFWAKYNELQSQRAEEYSAIEEAIDPIIEAIEQRPDTHGENPAFASALAKGSRLLELAHA